MPDDAMRCQRSRDNAIDVVWNNIADDWNDQYAEADGSQVYDIPYDYQSNMQYTGYANDPKVDMAAKERIYQHTMGSRTGVVFNDLKFLNVYNDCMCKSGASCQNGGFPHPRKCNQCICPDAAALTDSRQHSVQKFRKLHLRGFLGLMHLKILR